MPVKNDPKRPLHRRTAERVRAQQEVQGAGRAGEAGKARGIGGADAFVGVISSQELEQLDQLWLLHNYQKVVERLGEHAARLEGRDFAGLEPEALHRLAEQLFILEQRTAAALNKVSLVDARSTSLAALGVQRKLASIQTAVFRRAVELQDAATPAPVGQWVVFRDTQKKPGFHSPTAQEQHYLERLRKFIGEGGDPSQIALLDSTFLDQLKGGELVEYVVDAVDVARAAVVEPGRPAPGHTVLAKGGDVLTAGTLSVTKNERGQITQVMVGTFSGSYRSGLEAQHHLVRHLVAAGVPRELIIQREAQAGNPRTQEILARILGLDGPEAQRREQAVIQQAYRWEPLASTKGVPGAATLPKGEGFNRLALSDALQHMRVSVANALADGAILSTQPAAGGRSEVERVVEAIGEALRLAERTGNALVYGQSLALLRHLAALPAVHIDEVGRAALRGLLDRWTAHTFGEGPFDPASVFSAPPARDRRARVVATINPKATEAHLRDMIAAGMDIARFNTAHGTVDEQVALMKRVRAAAASVGREVAIQIDLEGPKIRLGKFENPNNAEFNDIILPEGERVTLTTAKILGTPKLLPVEYPTLCEDVKIGEPIFMNDGTVELKVLAVDKAAGTIEAEVVMGGKVWDRKGINLPSSQLSARTITEEDLENLEALLPHVDLVASSFVREPGDIIFLRKKMEDLGRVVPIIAKIERKEGLENLEQITIVSDALMVARGDLGVEIGYENVPGAERRINATGKLYGKPTMVATEVLMSMVKDPSRPSRGDVEGLYAAIYDRGADAIMLGKETSFPNHPAEVIRAASRVIEKAEEERRNMPWREELDVLGQGGGLPAISVRDLQRGAPSPSASSEKRGN
jgi:pyruvate kinase